MCLVANASCSNSKREEEMGQIKGQREQGRREGGEEREEKTPARKHSENEKHPLISRA